MVALSNSFTDEYISKAVIDFASLPELIALGKMIRLVQWPDGLVEK